MLQSDAPTLIFIGETASGKSTQIPKVSKKKNYLQLVVLCISAPLSDNLKLKKWYFSVIGSQIFKALKNQRGPLEIEKFFVEGVTERGWRGSGALKL